MREKSPSSLPHDSRLSNGANRSTRQGASFLILMFKINPRYRSLCDNVSPHHLTQNSRTKKFKVIYEGVRQPITRERIFGTAWPCQGETQIMPRLAGDCGLNGTREFTWGPSRGWVILRCADWSAVAVVATDVSESRPNVAERMRRDLSAYVSLRAVAMQPDDSFMHGYTGWPAAMNLHRHLHHTLWDFVLLTFWSSRVEFARTTFERKIILII